MMGYFEISVSPKYESSSGVIIVDNFHPQWKEGSRKLMSIGIEKVMDDYLDKIVKWSNVPMTLEFSENGLTHVRMSYRGALDLLYNEEKFCSHNIHDVKDVGAVIAVMSYYINNLNFAIDKVNHFEVDTLNQ